MCFGVDFRFGLLFVHTICYCTIAHVQVLKYNVNNTYNGIYIVLFKEGDIMHLYNIFLFMKTMLIGRLHKSGSNLHMVIV
jgi:hypothetical protein